MGSTAGWTGNIPIYSRVLLQLSIITQVDGRRGESVGLAAFYSQTIRETYIGASKNTHDYMDLLE